jgi:alcohol dehydrogenase class IV
MNTVFRSPAVVEFGGGASARVAEVARALGIARPLIVTDAFLVASGLVERITTPLSGARIDFEVYDHCMPEPTTASIDALVDFHRRDTFDGLIAFGGGSAIDSAKALAIITTFGGDYRQWAVPNTPNQDVLPIICIPTTAGTGSEVSNACILKDDAGKLVLLGGSCVPRAAVVDYELTIDLPALLTAATGIDALAHALEAYTSTGANPFSDAMARSALRLIGPNLRRVVADPGDRAAREAVMVGATQAGFAFSSASVTLVHGMTVPVGGLFHIQHGVSNAMFMPTVHAFSIVGAPDRYATAAREMGIVSWDDDEATAADKLIEELRSLNRDLQLPSLQDYGVDRERYFASLETMAQQAFATGVPNLNPRVPSTEEIIALYRAAWGDGWSSAAKSVNRSSSVS